MVRLHTSGSANFVSGDDFLSLERSRPSAHIGGPRTTSHSPCHHQAALGTPSILHARPVPTQAWSKLRQVVSNGGDPTLSKGML